MVFYCYICKIMRGVELKKYQILYFLFSHCLPLVMAKCCFAEIMDLLFVFNFLFHVLLKAHYLYKPGPLRSPDWT